MPADTLIDIPGHNRLFDGMSAGVNELHCECGVQLHPDCDVSSVSIAEEFDRHRSSVLHDERVNHD